VPKAIDWSTPRRNPAGFPGRRNEDELPHVLFQPCEIAIPAAIENQITEKNANQVQAKILCEGANAPPPGRPTRLSMPRHLHVPDILATLAASPSAISNGSGPPGLLLRESEVNERLFRRDG